MYLTILSASKVLMAFRQNTVTVNPSAVHPKSPNSQWPANADAVVKGKPRMETPRSEMAMLSSSMLLRVDRSFLLDVRIMATMPLPVVDTIPGNKHKIHNFRHLKLFFYVEKSIKISDLGLLILMYNYQTTIDHILHFPQALHLNSSQLSMLELNFVTESLNPHHVAMILEERKAILNWVPRDF